MPASQPTPTTRLQAARSGWMQARTASPISLGGGDLTERDPGSGQTIAPAQSTDGQPDRLPAIEVKGRQLREVTGDAVAALLRWNEPPHLFRRGGILVRLLASEAPTAAARHPPASGTAATGRRTPAPHRPCPGTGR
jgi:hypothetical protein